MLNYRDIGILFQIIDHCKRISSIIEPTTKEIFENDLDAKELTVFHIILIGELAKKLTDDFAEIYTKIDWKDIKGMRDKMIHHYDDVDYNIVWDAAFNDCPRLCKYCSDILKQSGINEEH